MYRFHLKTLQKILVSDLGIQSLDKMHGAAI